MLIVKFIQSIKQKTNLIQEMNRKNSKHFINKLQNLLQKIGKASDIQIQRHSIICQKIISELLKNQKLSQLTTSKFRLLSYEVILFCYENEKKIQINKQTGLQNNKLLMYLVSIKNLLASIQQLLHNKNLYDNRSSNNNGNFIYSEVIKRFTDGIDKINGFLNQTKDSQKGKFIQKKRKSQQIEINKQRQQEIIQQNQNDVLLQQMQQILLKKQKRISELNNTIKQNLIQINNLNLNFNQISEVNIKNNEIIQNISKQLNQIQQKNKVLQTQIQILKQKNRITTKLLQQNKKINLQQQNSIQSQKQQRRYSQSYQNKKNNQHRNSLQINNNEATSLSNFYHSEIIENNKLFDSQNYQTSRNFVKINQKKDEKNKKQFEELYRFLLCQASTIQELF